jgi:abortive infection bacteriophage resistance protein
MESTSFSETLMYVHQKIRVEPFKTVIVTTTRLKHNDFFSVILILILIIDNNHKENTALTVA